MQTDKKFNALVVKEKSEGVFTRSIQERKISDLPKNDILIKVHYSSLNYKDALSASGNKGVTRNYPHTPGIDAAGVVVESNCDKFAPGDEVICMGYDLGMNTPGAYGEYISVSKDWVLHLPKTISLRDSMILGTGGFTAAIGISEILKHGVKPNDGKVLVTGATGGVGIMAVAMLSKLGYQVTASSGKSEQYDLLKKAGASEIIGREEVDDQSGRGLLKSRWIAAFDTVGGNTLSTVLKSTSYGGIVTNCGNVSSVMLNVTIFPFILRSVRLVGIAAAETPMPEREKIWHEFLLDKFKLQDLDYLSKEVSLEELSEEIDIMLKGKQVGRVLVKL